MDRATRNLFAVLLVGIIVLTGGAALILGGSPPATDPGASPGTAWVVGVIVDVQVESLTKARSIQVRTPAGEVIAFDLTRLASGAQAPAGHLTEHQVTAEPVLVSYVEENGTRFAIRVDDVAPEPSPAP